MLRVYLKQLLAVVLAISVPFSVAGWAESLATATEAQALLAIPTGLGEETATAPATVEAAIKPALPWQVPYIDTVRHPSLNHIYRLHNRPESLQRQAVIVLPGRAQEKQATSWWRKFQHRLLVHQPQLMDRYDFYIFHYDSTQPDEVQNYFFTQEYRLFLKDHPTQRPVLITYSLGGVIARDVLVSLPALLERTEAVFGLATPYHGAPVFSPQLIRPLLSHWSPVRKAENQLTYGVYMMNKANLKSNLAWQNVDASLPTTHPAHKPLRFHESLPAVTLFRSKLIAYTSYVDTAYTNPKLKAFSPLRMVRNLPTNLLSPVLPSTAGVTVHGVMRWQSQVLAKAPLWDASSQTPRETGAFRFNDGVIPLSSQLYLPQRATPYTESAYEQASLAKNKSNRIFYNIDHVDMGHYRWPEGPLNTWDVLHPDDGKRTPMAWLFYDLARL